jgi:hypothetical protein
LCKSLDGSAAERQALGEHTKKKGLEEPRPGRRRRGNTRAHLSDPCGNFPRRAAAQPTNILP